MTTKKASQNENSCESMRGDEQSQAATTTRGRKLDYSPKGVSKKGTQPTPSPATKTPGKQSNNLTISDESNKNASPPVPVEHDNEWGEV